ncbi:MAG: acetolactate synthase small subunit [Alphaproteobacteria bacterium]
MIKTPKSAYSIIEDDNSEQRHTFAVIVDNRPGILARVVGMFSARGYNIESLTVSSIDKDKKRSRISIVTTGTKKTIQQIEAQLRRIVAVNSAHNVTESNHVEKEVVLIKAKLEKSNREEILRTAELFKAQVVDATDETMLFMVVDSNNNVKEFMKIMLDICECEVARSGVVAMSCDKEILDV